MTVLVLARALCLACSMAMTAYMTPAVYALAVGKQRYGDPARLVCWGFGILVSLFCLRWFLVPDSEGIFTALYVFGSIWALFTILAAKSYGRDGRVQ